MARFVIFLISVAVFLAAGLAGAEIYQYVDDGGGIHYVDDVNKVPAKYQQQVREKELPEVQTFTPPPQAAGKTVVEEEPPVKQPSTKKVELFVTSWCGYCKRLKRALDERGIAYTAYDVEKDPYGQEEYQKLRARGVPVTRVGDQVIMGYDPEAIMRALGQ